MKIELTENQRYELEELWFIYGNYGKKHTLRNHKFIQALLEHGKYLKDFYGPDTELVRKVDSILKGKDTK